MHLSLRLVVCVGLILAIPAGAQAADFGTWDLSASEKAREAGIGSISVTREGVQTQRDTWVVFVEVFDLDASPIGSMELRWPSDKSSDLRWTKLSGESYAVRIESEGLPSMEVEDFAAGEFVRWDWLCDMEAQKQSRKGRSYKSQEEFDAAVEESRRCANQVAVAGTDMGPQEAMEHYKPIWQLMGLVEGLVRTRMGFSSLQIHKKESEAQGRSQKGFLKFMFCPPGQEEHCPIPDPPAEFRVLGEGSDFGGEDPHLECCLEAWDDADNECQQRTFRDCCAVNTCVITNYLCPPICYCQRIGAMWGCINHC